MKVRNITISMPTRDAIYEVGGELLLGDKKQGKNVKEISVGLLRNLVRIEFSDGSSFVFRGFPISYVKE